MTQKKDKRRAAEARRATEGMRQVLLGYKARLEDLLRAEGMTLAQLRLLKAVEGSPEVSAAALARMCFVTPQTLQAVLVRAEREGWIVRGSSERNRRFVTASLTEAGLAVLELGWRMAADIEEKIWRGVKVSEMEMLNEVLEKGVANLEGEARAVETEAG